MSHDYFGALMRSSGLGAAATGVDPGGLEVDASPAAAELPSPTGWNEPVSPAAAMPMAAVPAVPATTAAPVVPAPLHIEPVEAGPADAVVVASAAVAARPDAAQAATGHAMVDAAMRWVAADPRQPPHAVHEAPLRPPRPLARAPVDGTRPAAQQDTAPDRPQPGPEPRPELVVDRSAETSFPDPTPLPERETRPNVLAWPRPARATAPSSAMPPTAPLAREDRIEVSIGAIHLRVDAPAAQTVAHAAPPPAAEPPAGASPFARGALSRRALRRL
jgi:hypothetical protein